MIYGIVASGTVTNGTVADGMVTSGTVTSATGGTVIKFPCNHDRRMAEAGKPSVSFGAQC